MMTTRCLGTTGTTMPFQRTSQFHRFSAKIFSLVKSEFVGADVCSKAFGLIIWDKEDSMFLNNFCNIKGETQAFYDTNFKFRYTHLLPIRLPAKGIHANVMSEDHCMSSMFHKNWCASQLPPAEAGSLSFQF